jgi:hypothetical protein
MREWYDALAEANVSEEAGAYACAVPLISEALASCASLQALMEAYYLPDATLQRLVRVVCLNSEISLRGSVAVGAACALRLRHLVSVAR